MKVNSESAERTLAKMQDDDGVDLARFFEYNVRTEKYRVVEHRDDAKGVGFVLSANDHLLVGPSDHIYRIRETAEAIARFKNLWLTPPRERGVQATADKAAQLWAKLTGRFVTGGHKVYRADADGNQIGDPIAGRWEGVARILEVEGKIAQAGFGRWRITDPVALAAEAREGAIA